MNAQTMRELSLKSREKLLNELEIRTIREWEETIRHLAESGNTKAWTRLSPSLWTDLNEDAPLQDSCLYKIMAHFTSLGFDVKVVQDSISVVIEW